MALTVEQLKELYQLIFVGNPTHLEELTNRLRRCGPGNWDAARDKIADLIPNADPNEDSQLACLKKILCGPKLAPLSPDFYQKIVRETNTRSSSRYSERCTTITGFKVGFASTNSLKS